MGNTDVQDFLFGNLGDPATWFSPRVHSSFTVMKTCQLSTKALLFSWSSPVCLSVVNVRPSHRSRTHLAHFSVKGPMVFILSGDKNVSLLWNRGSKPQSNWTPLLRGHFEVHCTSFNKGTRHEAWGGAEEAWPSVCFSFFFFYRFESFMGKRSEEIWKRGKLKNMLTHW